MENKILYLTFIKYIVQKQLWKTKMTTNDTMDTNSITDESADSGKNIV